MDGSRKFWAKLAIAVALFIAATWSIAPERAYAAGRRRGQRHCRSARCGKTSQHAPLYRAALLEDADSGKVLYSFDPALDWPPASMAKMMLLLVTEDQISAGRVKYEDPVRISWRAAHTGGSGLGLREGQIYPLGELMKAALVRSANDAAVAIAEKIAGSVEACVRMMNQRAQSLQMTHTEYGTVDGLPPRPTHDIDITNAFDLAKVARELIRKAGHLLKWSGQGEVPFEGGALTLRNTNHLVGRFYGCDGLKTGFTFRSGFNLTATARRGDMRLVAVVLGAPSNRQRFAQAAKLLEWGFANFRKVTVVREGQPLPVYVQVRSGPLIQPVAAKDIDLVVPANNLSAIKVDYRIPPLLDGPITNGEAVGEVIVLYDGQTMATGKVLSPIAVGEAAPALPLSNGMGNGSEQLQHASPPFFSVVK